MSMPVFRSPRSLIVCGVAATVALGGAGLAYASTGSSASPAAETSSTATSSTHAKHRKLPVGDLVTAINGTSLTADTPKGPKTFTLTSTTKYHRGSATLTESGIKAGPIVRIRTAKGGTTATSVAIAPAIITGYVQSLSGSTLTVLDRSGFAHKVSTTGATYKKNGGAGQASDVAAGGLVRVQGFIDADGSTVDAITIGVHQP
jgi:hypothetical protein